MQAPGTQLFAPQVRVVDAAGATVDLGEPAQPGQPATTVSDIVSVRVTLLASGTSTVQVTLNNQDRRKAAHKPDPGYPPWKYNSLQRFQFGQRFRIDFRYAGPGDRDAAWAPMIWARVTDMSFAFGASGATLAVSGEDFLSLLKVNSTDDKNWRDADEEQIFNDTLDRASSNLTGTYVAPSPSFGVTLPSVVHQKKTPYLNFLQGIADRMDYEIFCDNDVESADDVTVHFEPARSRTDGIPLAQPAVLEWGRDLVDFTPKLQIWDQYTKVSYKGTNPRQRQQIKDETTPSDLDADVRPQDFTTLTAIEARNQYFVDAARENDPGLEVSNVDAERAKRWAQAVLLKKARELLTAEVTTYGQTALRPGMFVELRQLRAPFDGPYYVTQTTHTLDASGYRTKLSLRRAWMYDPLLYAIEVAGR